MSQKSTKVEQPNINISRDDNNVNDYLYVWKIFGSRPNKMSLFNNYETSKFLELFSPKLEDYTGIFTEVVPTGTDYMVNEKVLVKYTEDIYVSWIQYDKLTEEAIIGEVAIYYSNAGVEGVEELVGELEEVEIELSQENLTRINTVTISQTGLEIDSIDLLKADYDNIENYFNDDVMKQAEKLVKSIKKTPKGLSIIWGERGTGKTVLVNWIASMLDKVVIFIPSSMIEVTVNNPEFRSFIKRYKNSVIVIDDSEIYFSELYTKSNIFTNNLLQLVDGVQSDSFDLNIITILNVDNVSLVDHNLFECNNLIDIIEVDTLDKSKASELAKTLGSKNKIKTPTKVVDVIKKRSRLIPISDIGFK